MAVAKLRFGDVPWAALALAQCLGVVLRRSDKLLGFVAVNISVRHPCGEADFALSISKPTFSGRQVQNEQSLSVGKL